jgi:hypothetical protein
MRYLTTNQMIKVVEKGSPTVSDRLIGHPFQPTLCNIAFVCTELPIISEF